MKKYIITSIVGLVLVSGCAISFGVFESEGLDILKNLASTFEAAGLLLALSGAMVFCSNEGVFHMFGYAAKEFILLFQTSDKKIANQESYAEYKERKAKHKGSFIHLVIVGSIILVIGIILNIIYSAII